MVIPPAVAQSVSETQTVNTVEQRNAFMSRLRERVGMAKKQQSEEVTSKLQAELDDLRPKVTLLERQLQALDATIGRNIATKNELSTELNALEEYKNQLNDYEELRTQLLQYILDAEKKVGQDFLDKTAMVKERDALVSRCSELQNLIVDAKRPKGPSLDDSKLPQHLLVACREQVLNLVEDYRKIDGEVFKYGHDMLGIKLRIRAEALRLRQFEFTNSALNESEKLVIHRLYGYLTSVVQKYGSSYIIELNPQWPCPAPTAAYNSAKLEHDQHRNRLKMEEARELAKKHQTDVASANRMLAKGKEEPEEAEKEDPEEVKLFETLMETGVIKQTEKWRVVVYGGVQTRGGTRLLSQWVEDVFKFSKFTWFETEGVTDTGELDRCCNSLQNGQVDLLIVMAHWCPHAGSSLVIDFAKKYGVRMLVRNNTNKTELAREIARSVGVTL